MDFGIDGKRALVLGGTKGLGWATAKMLAQARAHVAITGRDRAEAARRAVVLSPHARGFSLDLSAPAKLDPTLKEVRDAFGAIDILLLNGGGPPPSDARALDPAFWHGQFDAMFLSLTRTAAFFLPAMIEAAWGRIIIVSSTTIREPIAGLAASNALRAALAGWAKTLASEVAIHGVTVNLILPGSIATDRITGFDRREAEREDSSIDQVARRNQAAIPAGRYGRPEEFGAVAAFLASRQAAYITGAAIPVDGGISRSI